MSLFDRMRTTWFPPAKKSEREERHEQRKVKAPEFIPSVDERTAEAAKALLENEAFRVIIERLRRARINEFLSSKSDDKEIRDKAHLGVMVLDQIETDIQVIADELKFYERRKRDNDSFEEAAETPVESWDALR